MASEVTEEHASGESNMKKRSCGTWWSLANLKLSLPLLPPSSCIRVTPGYYQSISADGSKCPSAALNLYDVLPFLHSILAARVKTGKDNHQPWLVIHQNHEVQTCWEDSRVLEWIQKLVPAGPVEYWLMYPSSNEIFFKPFCNCQPMRSFSSSWTPVLSPPSRAYHVGMSRRET